MAGWVLALVVGLAATGPAAAEGPGAMTAGTVELGVDGGFSVSHNTTDRKDLQTVYGYQGQEHTDLDAMIPREDFAVAQETYVLDLIKDFPITHLANESPVLKLLRKPDFQRETNHWSPDQVVSLLASFLDG